MDDPRSPPPLLRSAGPWRRSGFGGVFAALSIIIALSVAVGAYAFWLQPVHRDSGKVATKKPKSAPTPETTPEPTPEPTPAPTPAPTPEPTPANVEAAVDRALGDAYVALKRHDEQATRRSLEAAVKAAGEHGDLVARTNRWKLLADYAKQLDGFQRQAIAAANEGRDYKIGDRTIAVIEIGPATFAYKERGQTIRGPRGSLPRPIERAILAQWFAGDNRDANHIFLGVHHLMDEKPDLIKVRNEWGIALAGDPATKSIIPLLDDPALTSPR